MRYDRFIELNTEENNMTYMQKLASMYNGSLYTSLSNKLATYVTNGTYSESELNTDKAQFIAAVSKALNELYPNKVFITQEYADNNPSIADNENVVIVTDGVFPTVPYGGAGGALVYDQERMMFVYRDTLPAGGQFNSKLEAINDLFSTIGQRGSGGVDDSNG